MLRVPASAVRCWFLVLVVAAVLPARSGAATIELQLTPTHDVLVGILVTKNIADSTLFSFIDEGLPAATFPAGVTTTLDVEVGLPVLPTTPYLFFGLYDDAGTRGVTIAMRDASAILAGQTYEDVFPGFSEGTMQVLLQSIADQLIIGGLANHPLDVYDAYGPAVGPPTSGVAQLVEFSTAKDGGLIEVRVIPEPGLTWMLAFAMLVAGAVGRGPWRVRPCAPRLGRAWRRCAVPR